MYLCCVDESGDLGRTGSRHLLLAAALVFESRWRGAKAEIDALLHRYFTSSPPPRELHCTDVRGGRGPFARLAKPTRLALLDEFCALTADPTLDVRLFAVVFDKAWWLARNPSKDAKDLYRAAFEDLVSRVDRFLHRSDALGRSAKGLMIADAHSGTLSAALRSDLGMFQQSGTRWSDVHELIETLMFLQSHESPGLQLADLCAYAVGRLVEHGDDRLARQLAVAFDRDATTAAVPGKWHGVKYHGGDATVSGAIAGVWAR